MNSNLYLAIKYHSIALCKTGLVNSIVDDARLKDDVRAGPSKTDVVSQNIDAVRELIMQDRHETYREIETYLGISSTSIHSILLEQLAAKKICSGWILHNLAIAQK